MQQSHGLFAIAKLFVQYLPQISGGESNPEEGTICRESPARSFFEASSIFNTSLLGNSLQADIL